MNIMVTGGSGFIGRAVVKQLNAQGHTCMIADITRPQFAFEGYFSPIDILDRAAVMRAAERVGAIMHLAGILGTAEAIDAPLLPARVNVLGSLNIYEACRWFDLPACNITVGNHFMLNTYAISKSTSERFALMYNAEHSTRIAVVRGLNAYGPWQKHRPVRKVIPTFALAALRGQPLEVYGDGRQVMDFIHVNDLAQILCRAMLAEHRIYDRVFEAGSGKRTTINQIAQMVIDAAKSESQIEHLAMRPGETPGATVLADVGTLAPLGVRAKDLITMEEGLIQTIHHYRRHLEDYQ